MFVPSSFDLDNDLEVCVMIGNFSHILPDI